MYIIERRALNERTERGGKKKDRVDRKGRWEAARPKSEFVAVRDNAMIIYSSDINFLRDPRRVIHHASSNWYKYLVRRYHNETHLFLRRTRRTTFHETAKGVR